MRITKLETLQDAFAVACSGEKIKTAAIRQLEREKSEIENLRIKSCFLALYFIMEMNKGA